MPVVKIKAAKRPVKQIEDYVKREDKTDESLYYGNLCMPEEDVAAQWDVLQQSYHKPKDKNTRTYYHLIISFHTGADGDQLTPEQCKKITQEILSKIPKLEDYPYFGCVHTDKPTHIHSHIIISNCSIYGKSFQTSKADLQRIKEIANEVAEKYGLVHSIINLEQKPAVSLSSAEAQMLLKRDKVPWKETLRFQIEDAYQHAHSQAEFVEKMKNKYGVEVIEGQKGYRYWMPGQKKPCPERRLGEHYTKAYICKNIQKNELKRKGPHI
jgi:hypothetical protein